MAYVFSLKAGPVTFHLQKTIANSSEKSQRDLQHSTSKDFDKVEVSFKESEKKSFWGHLIENKGLALETAGKRNCAVLTNF